MEKRRDKLALEAETAVICLRFFDLFYYREKMQNV
jgi:hypothetical protein